MLKSFRLRALLGSAVALFSFGVASSARADAVDLGQAGKYAAFALTTMSFNGPGNIDGNIAIGTSMNFAAPATVNGTVFLNTGVAQQGNVTPTGGFVHTDLTQAIADAQSAFNTANGLSATQTFGVIGGGTTITGNGGLNVIDATKISMSSGQLTLVGGPNDKFVFDIGSFTSSNSNLVLSGNINPANILFNVNGNVAITGGGGNNFYGTFLAPNSDISVHDKQLFGRIIGKTIEDTSGFKITTVPLPAPLIAVGVMLSGVAARRKMKKQEVAA